MISGPEHPKGGRSPIPYPKRGVTREHRHVSVLVTRVSVITCPPHRRAWRATATGKESSHSRSVTHGADGTGVAVTNRSTPRRSSAPRHPSTRAPEEKTLGEVTSGHCRQ